MNTSDLAKHLAALGSVAITSKGQLKVPRAVSASLTAEERTLLASDRPRIARAVAALRALAEVEAAAEAARAAFADALIRNTEARNARRKAEMRTAQLAHLAALHPAALKRLAAAGEVSAEDLQAAFRMGRTGVGDLVTGTQHVPRRPQ